MNLLDAVIVNSQIKQIQTFTQSILQCLFATRSQIKAQAIILHVFIQITLCFPFFPLANVFKTLCLIPPVSKIACAHRL